MTNNKPELLISRPIDESFEAFKKWILDLGKKLGAKDNSASDEELQEAWKKFWNDN